uniref:molybdate-anion transporter-like n=1 Tax=Styela clava TaxID=7725 RepID=UPI00193A27A2|nr:molybdate-anion transporter-like [Styela clava]
MLNIVIIVTFILAAVLSIGLGALHRYVSPQTPNTNPQFLEFQSLYFLAFFPALFADWLNAPYLYKLYSHYGFLEEQIAIIYVCGLGSALVFGTTAAYLVERYGFKKISLGAAVTYSLSCFLKLSSDYSTLVISRILSGASTTLLFSAHEGWYAKSHINVHDFPKEWIEITSMKSAFASSLMAAIAGVFAYFMTEWYGFGPVAPSLLAVPFLGISAFITFSKWKTPDRSSQSTEGLIEPSLPVKPSGKNTKFVKACCEGLQNIVRNPDLLVLGCVQSLFESVLCLFVFLWTPVLDHHHPPLGIVFATFMCATLCGGVAHKIMVTAVKLSSAVTLTGAMSVACIATLGCVLSTSPTNEFPIISYICFLLFELSVGVYFPSMSELKRLVKPELQNFAVTAWFRVPLNLFACFGLIMLHHSTNASGTRKLFLACFFMVAIAAVFSLRLLRTSKSKNMKDSVDLVMEAT